MSAEAFPARYNGIFVIIPFADLCKESSMPLFAAIFKLDSHIFAQFFIQ